jgi:hypothetical protein
MNTALRRTTSAAAGSGLGTTIKYLRRTTSGAARIGMSTTIKYLRGAVGFDLGTTIKYLRGFCSKLRAPHRGTSLGSCVCVGPDLSRCVH